MIFCPQKRGTRRCRCPPRKESAPAFNCIICISCLILTSLIQVYMYTLYRYTCVISMHFTWSKGADETKTKKNERNKSVCIAVASFNCICNVMSRATFISILSYLTKDDSKPVFQECMHADVFNRGARYNEPNSKT